jgi:hypothetical protein
MNVASRILRFVDRKISRWPGQDTALALKTLRKNNIKLTLNEKPIDDIHGRLGLEIRVYNEGIVSDRVASSFNIAWTIKNLAGKSSIDHLKWLGLNKVDVENLAIWSSDIYSAFQRLPVNSINCDNLKMNEEIMSSFFRFANSAKTHQEKAFAILVLCEALGKHDPKTVLHGIRTRKIFSVLAKEMGLDKNRIKMAEQAADVHDLGKLAVPFEILHRDNMSKEERKLVRRIHVIAGILILENIKWITPHQLKIILFHHYNNKYPPAVRHSNVPTEDKIIAVADSFDALVLRAHKTPDEAISILTDKKNGYYQPAVRALEAAYRSGKLSKIDPHFDPRYRAVADH